MSGKMLMFEKALEMLNRRTDPLVVQALTELFVGSELAKPKHRKVVAETLRAKALVMNAPLSHYGEPTASSWSRFFEEAARSVEDG